MCEAVISGGNSAEVLDAAEHALYGVAIAVEDWRETALPAAIGLGRNVGRGASGLDLSAHGVAVIALVAVDEDSFGEPFQQGICGAAISDLAAGQQESQWSAVAIGERVDLGRPPTARAPDGLVQLPPFPPAAQRCALTAEESIKTCAGGPSAEARA